LNPLESAAAALRGNKDFKLFTPPAFRCWYVFLNTLVGPMKDERVRKALNYAVDKQMIIDSVLYGFGREMGSFMPPGSLGYKMVDAYAYNPGKAKQLLAEAGYPNGFKTNLYTVSHYNEKIAQAIQGFWREVGVEADIISMENAAFTEFRKKTLTETDMRSHMQYVVINYPEAYKWNWVAFSEEFVPGGPYKSIWSSMGFTSPELQAIHKNITVTADPAERIKIYHRFQDITSNAAPFVSLFSQTWVVAARSNVDKVEVTLLGNFFFKDVELK